MHVERLPKDACIRTTPESRLREEMSVEAGLLAVLIEVTSIVATENAGLKKPITGLADKFTNKPDPAQKPRNTEEKDKAFKKGISVLAATSKAVNRG